jgi:hypothetical protein
LNDRKPRRYFHRNRDTTSADAKVKLTHCPGGAMLVRVVAFG